MDQLYALRNDFAIIGITGRNGSGCSEISKLLANPEYINSVISKYPEHDSETSDVDELKYQICLRYLKYKENWKPFKVIKYVDVLFYHLMYEACSQTNDINEAIDNFKTIIFSFPSSGERRFSQIDDDKLSLNEIINKIVGLNYELFNDYNCETLEKCLKSKEAEDISDHYFNTISLTSDNFFKKLKEYNFTKTKTLIHDLACNLRSNGKVKFEYDCSNNVDNCYLVAKTINRLIKSFRKVNNHGRIVIDSLKNSLELVYFKERYAAFYCIATNKLEMERKEYNINTITGLITNEVDSHIKYNEVIDAVEYKGKEVNKGEFSSPDVENCIQKSDYHIFWSGNFPIHENHLNGYTEKDVNLDRQLVKFVALLFQPGLITPTPQERTMQVAYNAKVNSGCISRQVGAVITDESHSVKAIGWNDVARYQLPCNLRNLEDLVAGRNMNHFSDFENGLDGSYPDGITFKEKVTAIFPTDLEDKLQGKNCSFCFKTCHNVFEGNENQVHTRSLHAEENAMLQITKYGGQGVKGGNLYTTASPCELCSKKAFQLGIKNIYYIDPYPGIATTHILKSAKERENNPTLIMFRGAVGRGFHKLYEPLMAYKDELNIRADLHPKLGQIDLIKKLTGNKDKQALIQELLSGDIQNS